MSRWRLFVTAAGAAAVVGSTVAAGPVVALPRSAAVVGHLAFVTNDNRLEEVTVRADGTTSKPHRLAPALRSSTTGATTLGQVFASGDGKWLAWTEYPADNGRPLVVVRNQVNGHETKLRTDEAPAAFAGDELIVTFNATKRLVLSPHPHFVLIKHAGYPLAGYPGGVVDEGYSSSGQSTRLRLTTFDGKHHQLHRYNDAGAPTYRAPDAGWVSGDGKHLVVERGNHQDFDGLGPSSLADEYSLRGKHARHRLGTFSASAGGSSWRVSTVTYVGRKDRVWAAWERATRTGAVTLVASYSGGKWHRRLGNAITVAGNRGGWIVIQPGTYGGNSHPEGFPGPVATGHAVLWHGSARHTLGVRGTQFFWVS